MEVGLVAAGMEGQDWVAWREACTRVGKAEGAGRLLWARGDCSRAGQSRGFLGPPQFGSPLALGASLGLDTHRGVFLPAESLSLQSRCSAYCEVAQCFGGGSAQEALGA